MTIPNDIVGNIFGKQVPKRIYLFQHSLKHLNARYFAGCDYAGDYQSLWSQCCRFSEVGVHVYREIIIYLWLHLSDLLVCMYALQG